MKNHGPTLTLIAVTLFCWTPSLLMGQDGMLDPSFSSDGIAVHGFGLSNDFARAVVQQPDGRILVAGNTFVNGNSEFGVLRMLDNGELDQTFDTVGWTSTTMSALGDAAFAMALQPDGKIILAGQSDNGINGMLGMMRYNADGSPDDTFGNEGIVTDDYGGEQVEIYAIALQPDGKILVAGNIYDGTGRMIVARYNSDGSADLAFNGTGMATVTFGEYGVAYGMALRPDGKIVLAGYTESGGNADLALAQLGSTGSLDLSFGTGGKVITHVGFTWERFRALALDADGAIIATGTVGMGFEFDTFDMLIARYLANGSLDTSFDMDGYRVIDHAGDEDSGSGVVLQSDGKILVCGGAVIAGQSHFALVRMDATGAMDNGFGTNGIVHTAMGSQGGAATSMTMQSDGKILLAGYHGDFSGTDFGIARYTSGLPQSLWEIQAPEALVLYPNPAREEVFVTVSEGSGNIHLEVMDERGRLCITQQASGTMNMGLHVADLAPGRYHVRSVHDGKVGAGSFIKLP